MVVAAGGMGCAHSGDRTKLQGSVAAATAARRRAAEAVAGRGGPPPAMRARAPSDGVRGKGEYVSLGPGGGDLAGAGGGGGDDTGGGGGGGGVSWAAGVDLGGSGGSGGNRPIKRKATTKGRPAAPTSVMDLFATPHTLKQTVYPPDPAPLGARVVASAGQSCAALRLAAAAASLQGKRPANEDAVLVLMPADHDGGGGGGDPVAAFGIYDGHNGAGVALHLAASLHVAVLGRLRESAAPPGDEAAATALMTAAFRAVDEGVLDDARLRDAGSCALLAVVSRGAVTVAGCGDSGALLCVRGVAQHVSAVHRPSVQAERARLEAVNPAVVKNGRVWGVLSVSRAFGDVLVKKSRSGGGGGGQGDDEDGRYRPEDLVCVDPAVRYIPLVEGVEFLVLGCDGLIDALPPQAIVNYVKAAARGGTPISDIAASLATQAIVSGGSQDNVSACIVFFNQWQ